MTTAQNVVKGNKSKEGLPEEFFEAKSVSPEERDDAIDDLEFRIKRMLSFQLINC